MTIFRSQFEVALAPPLSPLISLSPRPEEKEKPCGPRTRRLFRCPLEGSGLLSFLVLSPGMSLPFLDFLLLAPASNS